MSSAGGAGAAGGAAMDAAQGGADQHNPAKILSMRAVASNLEVVNFCRVFVCIFAGSACGILGLTGWLGMLFFAIVGVGVSTAMLLVKARMQPAVFLPSPNAVAFGSLFNGLMSYVLFWTLLYNVVHVY